MPGAKEIAPGRFRDDVGRTYEDFVVGHVYEHRPGRTITDADNRWGPWNRWPGVRPRFLPPRRRPWLR